MQLMSNRETSSLNRSDIAITGLQQSENQCRYGLRLWMLAETPTISQTASFPCEDSANDAMTPCSRSKRTSRWKCTTITRDGSNSVRLELRLHPHHHLQKFNSRKSLLRLLSSSNSSDSPLMKAPGKEALRQPVARRPKTASWILTRGSAQTWTSMFVGAVNSNLEAVKLSLGKMLPLKFWSSSIARTRI